MLLKMVVNSDIKIFFYEGFMPIPIHLRLISKGGHSSPFLDFGHYRRYKKTTILKYHLFFKYSYRIFGQLRHSSILNELHKKFQKKYSLTTLNLTKIHDEEK